VVEWFAYACTRKMNIIDVFPSPVYVESFQNKDHIKNIVKELVSKETMEKNSYCDRLFHIANNSESSILYEDIFDDLREWICHNAVYYIQSIIGYSTTDEVLITDSWINISREGAFQHPHYHTNSYVSGTYYISLDKESSPLEFYYSDIAPFAQQQSLILEKKNCTKYNSNVIVNVEEGDLVMWPSHLTHGFNINHSKERISISFNIMPTYMRTGTYGFKVSLL